jgi:hypothetical protein
MDTGIKASPTALAIWRLRAIMLFLIGPAAGLILVQIIFGMPLVLWWSAGAMSLFMLTIFVGLVTKERKIIVLQMQQRANSPPAQSK